MEDVRENIQGIYLKSILSTIIGVTQTVILERGTQLSERLFRQLFESLSDCLIIAYNGACCMAFDRLSGTLPQLPEYSQSVTHKRKTYVEASTNCRTAVDSLMERLR